MSQPFHHLLPTAVYVPSLILSAGYQPHAFSQLEMDMEAYVNLMRVLVPISTSECPPPPRPSPYEPVKNRENQSDNNQHSLSSMRKPFQERTNHQVKKDKLNTRMYVCTGSGRINAKVGFP